ncbi:MAG: helix-turn-helix domain-containing protein [Lachnospiraceae bacterium]|nr:helix-turn-helix domain-containing protein [Lachnospiraceae bacterium]
MFHKRLREMRNKKGLTQQKMSDLLNIALITYQKYEQGVRNPSFDCLIQIADILDVSIDYLFGRDDYLKSLGVSVDVFL